MRNMSRMMSLAVALILASAAHGLADEPQWRSSMAVSGTPRYPADFRHFDYANPEAPKRGEVHLSSMSAFDNLNPLLDKGVAADGLGLVFETLMTPSLDEIDISASYGLLAAAAQYPDDYSWVKFRLRPEARWQDGQPVTPEDVIWSFDELRKVNVPQANYYSHVVKAEATGVNEVTFTFNQKGNRELPKIVGDLIILPKHWWLAKGPDGKPRNVEETTLEPLMGSGPYRITAVEPGRRIAYQRDPNYWGANLPVNVGQNNFDLITYDSYRDRTIEFEAFKAGNVDYWFENEAKRWATGYDIAPVKDGRIKKEIAKIEKTSGLMMGFIPNLRRPQFQDQRVRRALNLVFNFEELNRTTFFGQYHRIDSYFWGTELASSGLPAGLEKDILESVKDKVPPSVFTTPYANPINDTPDKVRENLRAAVELFKQAGYTIQNGKMSGPDGKPFTLEILLDGPTIERVAVPYTQWLARIGVTASVRSVDDSQFVTRLNNRDYDIVYYVWAESLSPGNEQLDYWGSKAADAPSSKNYAGIKDSGVDALIERVILSKDRNELVAAVHALDRVLLAHDYVIPSYYSLDTRIAYWNKFGRPDPLPKFAVGFPTVWWAK